MSAAHPDSDSSNSPADAAAPIVSLATGRTLSPETAARRQQEQALVRAILDGDPDAFAALHALHADRIYRFAVKRLGDATEAEDVVQDTFLEVHRCLGTWEGRSTLLTWMFGIAHHQLCRRFRKRTPLGASPEQLEAAHVEAPLGSGEGRVDALRTLEVCADVLDDTVSPAQREIFDLYYGENRPTKEIAARLGKSNQAVKISLFRTRRTMESRLAEQGLQESA